MELKLEFSMRVASETRLNPLDVHSDSQFSTYEKHATIFRRLSVIAVPPAVALRGLSNMASFRSECWVREMELFTAPNSLAATQTTPPTDSIKDLKPGHYMIWAVAVSDHGATSQPLPVHVTVEK